ncbi:glycoside hydrolase family 13 protein [Purpureocillium lilacinum]|uniref:Glycoside hydrolase family 13 protein n=1 Tax=Purpureocillium lilacinum TaxID=33203 RepID=A0A179HT96_PURLI|nr:glycoside hydrolase family 13 protein [Purpureocillium lilacinum]OAQ93695.1 glycoside hydrolase family 13 protein [Purpureocillium lilacinum]
MTVGPSASPKGVFANGPQRRTWWKEASVYQIYPASFCDANGDGFGDIPGVVSKLDYLKALGVDVVWLCPGSAWSYDEHTGEYYLRLFAREQPDLNWENPAVVREVHDVMDFWLSKGVDGFRMDVINLISKTPGFPDAPITIPHDEFQPAHIHYAYGPRLHEFLRGLRRILDKYDAFSVGEMPWVDDERDVIRAVAADRMELNMIFQMDIVSIDYGPEGKFSPKPWTLPSLKAIVEKWQTYMYNNNGWNALFLENHDQSRSVSRFTPHRPTSRKYAATMLATFIGLQAGTLFIYQGQELGMANLPESWPTEEYKDVETQTLYQLSVNAPSVLIRDMF